MKLVGGSQRLDRGEDTHELSPVDGAGLERQLLKEPHPERVDSLRTHSAARDQRDRTLGCWTPQLTNQRTELATQVGCFAFMTRRQIRRRSFGGHHKRLPNDRRINAWGWSRGRQSSV